MRKPHSIEQLYLDFDGFFASVMQQAMPVLRNRPVGVIPFDTTAAHRTVVIACSKEAKARGCRNIMPVPEALRVCPDLVLVPQRPDLYRRAHGALLAEIACELPIDAVKSIDELTCVLDRHGIADPHGLASRIKTRLRVNIGPYITCSIGFAANRLLAKIACKIDKPNGVTIWPPEIMPGPLETLTFDDVPGIGGRMAKRLERAGVFTIRDLLHTQPKQLRALWGNVNGERVWYALHGYDIQAEPSRRGMYGHGRALPPELRTLDRAYDVARLLLTKAARRMRRDRWYARRLTLWIGLFGGGWSADRQLLTVNDDQACLSALAILWQSARNDLGTRARLMRIGVTLFDLVPADQRQLDLFHDDDAERRRWERATSAIDHLNRKYGSRVVTLGPWSPPPGGHAGGKIAFTRIPSAEDFW